MSKSTKRTVRCEHSDDISKCPPCWGEFTGSKSTEQRMEALGFRLVTIRGRNTEPFDKYFMGNDGLYPDSAEKLLKAIDQQVKEARAEEWQFYKSILSDHDLREMDRQTLNTMRMHVEDS